MGDLESILFSRRGGVKAAAEACGISPAAVSQWKKAGIPAKRRAAVAQVLGVDLAEAATTLASVPKEVA
jgi:DNA-binding transcriptional regulator YdaS (Cro superfamily)